MKKNIKSKSNKITILIVSLICILCAAIIVMLIVFLFKGDDENRDINQSVSSSENSGSTEIVPADAGGNSQSEKTISEGELKIKVGEKIIPILKNAESSYDVSGWKSSNTAVATVSDDGEITGISEGSCKVTVNVKSNGTILELDVIVEKNEEHEIVERDGLTYVDGILIANKTYSLPQDYNPGVDSEASDAFYEMQSAAAAEGLDIYISSGFRSYDDQDRIYNNYVSYDGQELADTYSARPGHSEHQTGLAFDLNSIDDSFADTAEGEWVAANAHKYGFIIRYAKDKVDITGYQYEPWHIRYLGVDIATQVYESGLCLEEYLGIDSKYQ